MKNETSANREIWSTLAESERFARQLASFAKPAPVRKHRPISVWRHILRALGFSF